MLQTVVREYDNIRTRVLKLVGVPEAEVDIQYTPQCTVLATRASQVCIFMYVYLICMCEFKRK